jgi:ferredoxin
MIKFHVNKELCISCGQCVADCLMHIIDMRDGKPSVDRREGLKCIGCQHCMAICPVGAISVQGVKPEECLPLKGAFPEPDKVERLIKGRRSVRRYQEEGLEPALIKRLLDVASYAPTGKNVRRVRFTVIDSRAMMDKFRAEALGLLVQRAHEGKLAVRRLLPSMPDFGRKRRSTVSFAMRRI